VVNWFHRRRLDQSPPGKYGFEFASRIQLMAMTCRKCAKVAIAHTPEIAAVFPICYGTLFPVSARSSGLRRELKRSSIQNSPQTIRPILDPRSNLMPTPARVSEQVSASVPESRLFVRRTASDPNDFVKGMSIAISTAERIR
jgi:hypothetical protein